MSQIESCHQTCVAATTGEETDVHPGWCGVAGWPVDAFRTTNEVASAIHTRLGGANRARTGSIPDLSITLVQSPFGSDHWRKESDDALGHR